MQHRLGTVFSKQPNKMYYMPFVSLQKQIQERLSKGDIKTCCHPHCLRLILSFSSPDDQNQLLGSFPTDFALSSTIHCAHLLHNNHLQDAMDTFLFVCFICFWLPPYLSSFTDLPLCSSHLRSLLSSESDLRRHDALAFHNQQAAGAAAVPPAAKAFVAFQTRNDAVVSTAGAFWTASHLAWLHLGLLLLSLREQNHFIFSSVPGTSVRPCHIENFFRF